MHLKPGQKVALLNERSSFIDLTFDAGTAIVVGNSDDTERFYKEYLERNNDEDIINIRALLDTKRTHVVFLGNQWRLLGPDGFTLVADQP
jgi:hypothetical protein